MKKSIFTLLVAFASPVLVSAHGGVQPGPHGGSIEMPGAFHTEVVMNKDQSVKVFLLDMNFQNATIKDSSVVVSHRGKGKTIGFTCTAMADHFHCLPSARYPAKGELVLQAVREKAVGNQAIYKLPLKFASAQKKQESEESHSHH